MDIMEASIHPAMYLGELAKILVNAFDVEPIKSDKAEDSKHWSLLENKNLV